MNMSEVPVVDVRGPLTAQRGRLLGLLASLNDEQWAAPTAAPAWSVKDIALHLLDVDLSWVARDRDHDRAGMIPMSTRHEQFVRALGERNQRWVDGARTLSPRLITGLLQWAGEQLDAHLGTIDLAGASSVYWAGDVPLWFDLAREFTERWVHYRQIRDAVLPAGSDQPPDEFLPLVLRTFVWGFPHQYRAPAPEGTAIAVEVPGSGAWILTRTATGWSLSEGEAVAPAARLRMSGEAAWRLLTGARYDASQVQLWGDQTLAEPLLSVRGIIVLDEPGGPSNRGRISIMSRFRKRGILIAAVAIAIGAGIGTATLAVGSAHAQGSGSITITGVGTDSQGQAQFPQVTVSVTCPVNDRFLVDATTVQGAASEGSLATEFCTGNAQNVTVNTAFPSSSAIYPGDGAGPVLVGATLQFVPPGINFDNPGDTYIGTTANLTFP